MNTWFGDLGRAAAPAPPVWPDRKYHHVFRRLMHGDWLTATAIRQGSTYTPQEVGSALCKYRDKQLVESRPAERHGRRVMEWRAIKPEEKP